MPYELKNKLVIGVASSALFDLTQSDKVFREKGEKKYRKFQEKNIDKKLKPGVAYPFIKRLLSLNDLSKNGEPLVEVIVLSRNDPETGLRVMRSIRKHKLDISRSIFMQGRSPHEYMGALNMSLFLSANKKDVESALAHGYPAGQVIGTPAKDPKGTDVRIAFDFDGVLADDSSEKIMKTKGLPDFHRNELERMNEPMRSGHMRELLKKINHIQDIEEELIEEKKRKGKTYNRRLHVAVVTARNAPANERVVLTLQKWGVRVNDAFFLGGIEKAAVLSVLRPHIFFDDQISHIEKAALDTPCVHVPYGVANEN